MKHKKGRNLSKDKFLASYNGHYRSIARLIKKHKHRALIGFILNLLEGVTSVERLSRQLQRDYNLTFRLIDEIKDANAKLFRDLPKETFNKVTELFAELNFLISRRLHEIQLALYHNREIPNTRLPATQLRKSIKAPKKTNKRRSRSRTVKKAKR